MQVIGLSKTTESPDRIVLVLDEEMTNEVLTQIDYGTLQFEADGKLLTVILPTADQEIFSHESVASLNRKLANAVAEVNAQRNKHHRMLQGIAEHTRLPLV